MDIFAQTGHTAPSLATHAMKVIVADESVPAAPTGWPSYKGEDIDSARWGMVLEEVTWSSDRGNWMWDGALVVLRALGVDTSKPL